jgi:thiosulfate dehydrogenase (quinone) large subunit
MDNKFTTIQLWSITVMRVLIGWHLLYEGIFKIMKADWSAAGFLSQSKWILEGFFKEIAGNPTLLNVVNLLNIWGLILIGLALILGLFTRFASISGMVLIALYYLSNPPMPGLHYSIPMEGNYLIVNKNLIEISALFVIYIIPTGKFAGLDRIVAQLRSK